MTNKLRACDAIFLQFCIMALCSHNVMTVTNLQLFQQWST